jgi:hypothetical protein
MSWKYPLPNQTLSTLSPYKHKVSLYMSEYGKPYFFRKGRVYKVATRDFRAYSAFLPHNVIPYFYEFPTFSSFQETPKAEFIGHTILFRINRTREYFLHQPYHGISRIPLIPVSFSSLLYSELFLP